MGMCMVPYLPLHEFIPMFRRLPIDSGWNYRLDHLAQVISHESIRKTTDPSWNMVVLAADKTANRDECLQDLKELARMDPYACVAFYRSDTPHNRFFISTYHTVCPSDDSSSFGSDIRVSDFFL